MYTQETFDEWIKEIPEKLNNITGEFAKKNNLKLDYSMASLDALEKWILKHYDVATDLKDDEDVLDMLALYVGETFMKHIGGEWYYEIGNEKSLFYKQILMKYDEDGDVSYRSARALCTSCISRNKGNLISSTLKKSITKVDL